MNETNLFLKTVDDLKKKVESNDPYELLMAAGLVRKLFLDKHSLVDVVNRDFGVKLEFMINPAIDFEKLGIPKPTFYSIQDGVGIMASRQVRRVSRDEFFQSKIGSLQEMDFTVKDFVKFVSNKLGGVHLDKSLTGKTDEEKLKQEALFAFNKFLKIGSMDVAIRQMKGVATSCLQALEPLKSKIK